MGAGMTGKDRRIGFEAIVIQMLWLILKTVTTGNSDWKRASDARANALMYLDYNGNQSEGAAEFRREQTLPDLPWGQQ